MDWQLVVALNLMVVSLVLALMALQIRFPGYGAAVAAHGTVVGTGLAAWFMNPDLLLPVVLLAFVLLVALPILLNVLANRAAQRGDHATFERFTRLAARLLPSRRGLLATELALATRKSTDIEIDAALSALDGDNRTAEERAAIAATRAATRQDWTTVLTACAHLQRDDLIVAPQRLRALGEMNRLDELVDLYDTLKTRLIGAAHSEALLFIFAFTGHPEATERLLQSALTHYPLETKRYWLARARRRRSHDDAEAAAALTYLAETASRIRTRLAAAQALQEDVANPSPPTRLYAMRAARRLQRDRVRHAVPWHRLRTTLALIVTNLGMFAASEWYGGSESLETLWTLGAMWPPSITVNDEWWRLATASVLHFGPLHLVVNTVMLSIFGRDIETRLGSLATLAVYVAAGIGSTAIVYALMRGGIIPESILIGASGAIFGLVGALLAIEIREWWSTRDHLDRSRVRNLLMLLAIQSVVDFAIPNVSFAGHASGFAIGLVVGFILPLFWAPNEDKARTQ